MAKSKEAEVRIEEKGNVMTVTITGTDAEGTESKSKKSNIVATTGGFVRLSSGLRVSLNLIR